MNKKILVPDKYIIDFSLTKEEREKKGKEYEAACNKAFKKLDLLEGKKGKNIPKNYKKRTKETL